MGTINDWFNENEFSTPFELNQHTDSHGDPAQFTGWSYLADYTQIEVRYTGGHDFYWDCQNKCWLRNKPE